MLIDQNLPGGNVVVKGRAGASVTLGREMRDTVGPWFYWKFRAVFDDASPVTFRFDDGPAIGARGPAVSRDRGETWQWHGAYDLATESFVYQPQAPGEEAWFCQCVPYMEKDLRRFLDAAPAGAVQVSEFCRSPKGRATELLTLGKGPRKIVMTTRHHAQEALATFVLEGVLADFAASAEAAAAFTVFAVPFMDKDGVEDGDQSKNRAPHDYARDYGEAPIYPAVKAAMELVERERPELVFDLHCPWLRGDSNETLFFVGSAVPRVQKGIDRLGAILARRAPADFPYSPADDVHFGELWNTNDNYTQGRTIVRWAADLPWQPEAVSIEVPFANTHDVTVGPTAARHLGRALAGAIRNFLG